MAVNNFIQWSISLTDQEEKDLLEFLKSEEYEPNKDGLKKLIMDIVYEEGGSVPNESAILKAVRENPDAILDLGKAFGGVVKKTLLGNKK